MTPNKQLQRTVIRHRGRAASASFHYALAARSMRQRAAAELRRYAAELECVTAEDKLSAVPDAARYADA